MRKRRFETFGVVMLMRMNFLSTWAMMRAERRSALERRVVVVEVERRKAVGWVVEEQGEWCGLSVSTECRSWLSWGMGDSVGGANTGFSHLERKSAAQEPCCGV